MTPARRITHALGGDWCGSFGKVPGPGHTPADRSLAIRDRADGRGIVVNSFAGDDWRACRDYLEDLGLLDGVEVERAAAPVDNSVPDKRTLALKIWRAGRSAIGTPVEAYLRSRAITVPPPPSLRFDPACWHGETKSRLPAMIAGVQDGTGAVVAVHRTYLTADGRAKADVREPKMALGPLGDGAVRRAAAGPTLGLTEGVEDALSATQLFDVPVWAVLGVKRLDKVALPDSVRVVIIFADNGDAGRLGASRAAEAMAARGRRVRVKPPPARFPDWNDALRAVAVDEGAAP